MSKLTEEMVLARTRQSNLSLVLKLNCWGTELEDISIIRRLPNVEMLSLSVNRIRSLADFQYCKKLQHLYVRKNEIHDLNEICYLRDLPDLSNLWLAENPCTDTQGYRISVIRNLPKLAMLDQVVITDVERKDALRYGKILTHPEDECSSPAPEIEPEMEPECADEAVEDQYVSAKVAQDDGSIQHRSSPQLSPMNTSTTRSSCSPKRRSVEGSLPGNGGYSGGDEDDITRSDISSIYSSPYKVNDENSPPRSVKQEEDMEEYQPRPQLTRSHTESLRRISLQDPEDLDEYHHGSLGRCRLDTMSQRGMRQELEDEPRFTLPRSRTAEMLSQQERDKVRLRSNEIVYLPTVPQTRADMLSQQERDRVRVRSTEVVYLPTAPRARNINVLNAVLCLIKELEHQDLELVAMNIRCRIDELRADELRD